MRAFLTQKGINLQSMPSICTLRWYSSDALFTALLRLEPELNDKVFENLKFSPQSSWRQRKLEEVTVLRVATDFPATSPQSDITSNSSHSSSFQGEDPEEGQISLIQHF
jgi:hypothetical protein